MLDCNPKERKKEPLPEANRVKNNETKPLHPEELLKVGDVLPQQLVDYRENFVAAISGWQHGVW